MRSRFLARGLIAVLWVSILPWPAGPVLAEPLSDLLGGKAADPAPPAGDKVISATSSPRDDQQIRRRLQEIFSELDNLRNVDISVGNGIVTLKGQTDSSATTEKAARLAGQIDGVVEVQNQLEVNRDLDQRLRATQQKILNVGKELAAGLPLFLLAVLVLALFWWLGSWLSNRQRLFRRFAPNPFIASLIGQIVHLALVVTGLILALFLVDATGMISTILGAAGIIGLAVGFAVRDTVENYLASVLLSIRNPFSVNDFVTIEGYEGNILRLTSRATVLISPDGNHIRIPNATVFKAVITNYTSHPERRFQFDLGVADHHDLPTVQSLASKTVTAVPGVLDTPKPLVLIQEIGDFNVLLRIFAWVNQRTHDFGKVRSEAIREVKHAFDTAGIVMPEPTYQLWLHQDGEGGQAKVAAAAIDRGEATLSPPPRAADVSADRTIENKVAAEQSESDSQNLLDPRAPKEL